MERVCKTCSSLISQKKTYATDINMLKRKPANEYHQMLRKYEAKYEPRQNIIDVESAKEILMKEDDKMVVKNGLREYMMQQKLGPTRNTKIFQKTKRNL